MNLFFKNVSIYGILPLIGRFMGFFLVPIYARVFNSSEFGQIELVTTLVSFLAYLARSEFYTSVGRYFYQKSSIHEQQRLISTGLWLTILTSAAIVSLCFVFRNVILEYYLNSKSLGDVLNIGLMWLFLDGVLSYLNVIPRYTNKAKAYVMINATSAIIRVSTTIFFVLTVKTGIKGVLYGHICGSIISIISNLVLSRKLLAFVFDSRDARRIFSYAMPLVPSVMIAGIWFPASRKVIELKYSLSIVGLYAFASRITSITSMFKDALLNAWRPFLFENIVKPSFFSDVRKNSSVASFIILGAGSIVALFAFEICLIVGTEDYAASHVLVPFLCLAGYFQSETQLRGFGPLINDKTYLISTVTFVAFAIAICFMLFVANTIGLYGLGISIVLFEVLQYAYLYAYTKKRTIQKKSLVCKSEYYVLLLFFASTALSLAEFPLWIRGVFCIFLIVMLLRIDWKYFSIVSNIISYVPFMRKQK